jgi:hypothetical protein
VGVGVDGTGDGVAVGACGVGEEVGGAVIHAVGEAGDPSGAQPASWNTSRSERNSAGAENSDRRTDAYFERIMAASSMGCVGWFPISFDYSRGELGNIRWRESHLNPPSDSDSLEVEACIAFPQEDHDGTITRVSRDVEECKAVRSSKDKGIRAKTGLEW